MYSLCHLQLCLLKWSVSQVSVVLSAAPIVMLQMHIFHIHYMHATKLEDTVLYNAYRLRHIVHQTPHVNPSCLP